MRIDAIAHALPGELVTNAELVDRVIDASRCHLEPSGLILVRRRLERLLSGVGAVTRYHRLNGERAHDFGVAAGRKALERAELAPADIDLLIYAGVGRGFIEPATAGFFQHSLGLTNATCFDVLDACASWLRALDVVHHMLRSGAYRHALILNCEFNFHEFGSLAVESLDALASVEAGATIGEAATATVVSARVPSSEDGYYATFQNQGAFGDLCQIPLPAAGQFVSSDVALEQRSLRFYARSLALNGRTIRALERHYWSDKRLRHQPPDITFGHTTGLPATRKVAQRLRLDIERHYEIFPRYGNIVAASLPLAMSLAIEEGALQRDQHVLMIMGSAGITTGFCAFDF